MSVKQCPYCGATIPADAVFCPNCGAQLSSGPTAQPAYQQSQPATPTYVPQQAPPPVPPQPTVPTTATSYPVAQSKEKDTAIAAILSFLLPGLGQIYVGKVGRGIGIFIGAIIIAFISFILFFIPSIIYWAWNIYDAYNLAKTYNEEYRRTGSPPW
ncbi:MAG: zinc-ribbon domain-containing protein [Candidatus Asgardarchaeia archaeon]